MGNAMDVEQGGGAGRPVRRGADTDETRNLDNKGIYEMNSSKLKKQDDLLEMIGHTADRLNEIGKTIGREVDEQTPLIGKLAGGVDSGTDRINKATRQVKAQSDAGATPWCLWYPTLIIVLTSLLIYLFVHLLFIDVPSTFFCSAASHRLLVPCCVYVPGIP